MAQLPQHLPENPLNVLSLGFNPSQFNQLHFGLIEQMHAAALKMRAARDLPGSPVSPLTASDSPGHLPSSASLAVQLANGTSNGLTNIASTPSAVKNSLSAFSVDALLGAAAKQTATILESKATNLTGNSLTGNNLSINHLSSGNLSSNSLFNASLSSSSSSSSVESANQNSQPNKCKPNEKAKSRIKRLIKKEKSKPADSDRSRSSTPDAGQKGGQPKAEAKSEHKKPKKAEKSKSSNQNSKSSLEQSKLDTSLDGQFDDDDLLDEDELEDEENLNVCDDSMDYDDMKPHLKNELVQQHLAHYPLLNSMQRRASPSGLLSAGMYNPLPPSFYSNFFPTLPLSRPSNGEQPSNSSNSPATINGQSPLAGNYFANANWPSFLSGPPPFSSFPGLGLANSKLKF